MNKLTYYIKIYSIGLIYILLSNIIISLLYLYTNIPSNINNILLYIVTIILFIYLSFKVSKNSNKKGYISGLITGIINVLIMFILSIIFKNYISINKLIYYISLILFSIVSGIIGINVKK